MPEDMIEEPKANPTTNDTVDPARLVTQQESPRKRTPIHSAGTYTTLPEPEDSYRTPPPDLDDETDPRSPRHSLLLDHQENSLGLRRNVPGAAGATKYKRETIGANTWCPVFPSPIAVESSKVLRPHPHASNVSLPDQENTLSQSHKNSAHINGEMLHMRTREMDGFRRANLATKMLAETLNEINKNNLGVQVHPGRVEALAHLEGRLGVQLPQYNDENLVPSRTGLEQREHDHGNSFLATGIKQPDTTSITTSSTAYSNTPVKAPVKDQDDGFLVITHALDGIAGAPVPSNANGSFLSPPELDPSTSSTEDSEPLPTPPLQDPAGKHSDYAAFKLQCHMRNAQIARTFKLRATCLPLHRGLLLKKKDADGDRGNLCLKT